jgi:hypothetical protein
MVESEITVDEIHRRALASLEAISRFQQSSLDIVDDARFLMCRDMCNIIGIDHKIILETIQSGREKGKQLPCNQDRVVGEPYPCLRAKKCPHNYECFDVFGRQL